MIWNRPELIKEEKKKMDLSFSPDRVELSLASPEATITISGIPEDGEITRVVWQRLTYYAREMIGSTLRIEGNTVVLVMDTDVAMEDNGHGTYLALAAQDSPYRLLIEVSGGARYLDETVDYGGLYFINDSDA